LERNQSITLLAFAVLDIRFSSPAAANGEDDEKDEDCQNDGARDGEVLAILLEPNTVSIIFPDSLQARERRWGPLHRVAGCTQEE
jgi:hypothetical protein